MGISTKLMEEIQKLSERSSVDNLADALLFVTEELGEVAECIAVERGVKFKKVKEPTKSECADVMTAILRVYFMSGGTIEELPDLMRAKFPKWEKRITQAAERDK
jgi:NTP pyrophosphatase (non-canonical NTP hydrolase)